MHGDRHQCRNNLTCRHKLKLEMSRVPPEAVDTDLLAEVLARGGF